MSKSDQEVDAIRELCTEVFRAPHRITQCLRMPVMRPIGDHVHTHDQLLQLDLAVGCKGGWRTPGGLLSAGGLSAAAFFPRQPHGCDLRPQRDDAELFSLKIQVPMRWPEGVRPFPDVDRDVPVRGLLRAARRVVWLAESAPPLEPARVVALAELLCAWPRITSRRHASPDLTDSVDVLDQQLAPVVRELDRMDGAPPTLDQLAALVHLSPRQLTRRFSAALGCTPHEYAQSRRLDHARALLLQTDSPLADISEQLGFSSEHHFSRWFRDRVGLPPGRFRRGGSVL